MKLIFISDTHGCHRELDLPKGDIIIHAGDLCNQGNQAHIDDFLEWYSALDFEYRIFIHGNHDRDLHQNNIPIIPENIPENITYLNNSFIHIQGLKIWGSPFQEEDDEMGWEQIADDSDIIITHNPPYEILDKAPSGNLRGSKKLRERIHQIQPKLHLFGHIHFSYGQIKIGETLYMNGSNYKATEERIINPYFEIDL